jgi:hypothetical protein
MTVFGHLSQQLHKNYANDEIAGMSTGRDRRQSLS